MSRLIRTTSVIALLLIAASFMYLYIWPTYFSSSPPSNPSLLPTPTSTVLPSPVATATPLPSPKPSVAPTPTEIIKPPPKTYTVVPGDTLSQIANKFGLLLSYLISINPQIDNPNLIYPGQVIALTGTPVVRPTPAILPPLSARAIPIYRIKTAQPVVFLTIDDGIYKTPEAAAVMNSHGLVASLFLTYSYIKDNPAYFLTLSRATGSRIEAHTYSHQNLLLLSYGQQYNEIQNGLDSLEKVFGQRPRLFRPPFGNFNDDTRLAAGSLGIRTMVLWDVTVNNGVLAYALGTHLQPGDIVLMHFRSTFSQDITAFSEAMQQQGLHTELLENWLP